MKKPTVKRGPASQFASEGELIVEVWDPNSKTGCLLSLRSLDGKLVVMPYRGDPGVVVQMHGRHYKVPR